VKFKAIEDADVVTYVMVCDPPIPAGEVGMIMAVFVPNSGYKCSKN